MCSEEPCSAATAYKSIESREFRWKSFTLLLQVKQLQKCPWDTEEFTTTKNA